MKDISTSKTPLRISLIGGGSDLEAYYAREGYGSVISTSIDKYIYITSHKRFDDLIRASYAKTEVVDSVDKLSHQLVRESLKFLGIKKSIEVVSISDVTAHGTGLGSSSAYTVGLLNSLSKLTNTSYNRFNLANDACTIEIDLCGEPIGKQDQFAAAFGGLNEIIFTKDSIDVIPLNASLENIAKLENNLLLFDTGLKRKSSDILQKQTNAYLTKRKFDSTTKLVSLVKDMKSAILNDVDLVGDILNEGWRIKQSIVDGISNTHINSIYETAMANGATGAKLCGAGGGGFLLFYVEDDNKEQLRKSLSPLRELEFNFDYEGATIL